MFLDWGMVVSCGKEGKGHEGTLWDEGKILHLENGVH